MKTALIQISKARASRAAGTGTAGICLQRLRKRPRTRAPATGGAVVLKENEMFKEVARDTDKIWEHETKPHWIVHYPATRVTGEHYQAYQSVERIPAGRKPWTVDNRRIGTQDGYRTLDEAMQAAA